MVVYNLKETPFVLVRDGFKFHFSSQYNLTRFLDREENEIAVISASLSNRFKFYIKADMIARIALYKKIEKRGFCIITDEQEEFQWLKA